MSVSYKLLDTYNMNVIEFHQFSAFNNSTVHSCTCAALFLQLRKMETPNSLKRSHKLYTPGTYVTCAISLSVADTLPAPKFTRQGYIDRLNSNAFFVIL